VKRGVASKAKRRGGLTAVILLCLDDNKQASFPKATAFNLYAAYGIFGIPPYDRLLRRWQS